MIQKAWSLRLIRFICVGTVNTTLDFVMLNIFVGVAHLPVLLANIISVCIGVTVSYFLNHHIVFRHSNQITFKMYLRFFVITGISVICVQTAVIYLASPIVSHIIAALAENLGNTQQFLVTYNEQLTLNISKALAVLAGLAWNYVLYSRVVFKTTSSDKA